MLQQCPKLFPEQSQNFQTMFKTFQKQSKNVQKHIKQMSNLIKNMSGWSSSVVFFNLLHPVRKTKKKQRKLQLGFLYMGLLRIWDF